MSGEIERVELLNAMSGMAEACWKFFGDLKREGFTDDQALRITMTWVHGVLGGDSEQ